MRCYYIYVKDRNVKEILEKFLQNNGIEISFVEGNSGFDAVVFIPSDKKGIAEQIYYLSLYYKFIFRRIHI